MQDFRQKREMRFLMKLALLVNRALCVVKGKLQIRSGARL